MSFPQSQSTAPVIAGQDYYRLFTQLSSAGDIYESEVSALGFAFGPDSDLSSVRITYPDPRAANGISQVRITPDRNFVGRVDALNGDTYNRSTTRRGRILISVDDIYSPQWRPAGFDSNVLTGDRWEIIPPNLDVIQYFSMPPGVTPARSDKSFRWQFMTSAPGAGKRSFIAVPTYGRKSGHVTILNNTGADCDVVIGAVRFALSDDGTGTNVVLGTERVLSALAALANGAVREFVFAATTHGFWDYFYVGWGGAVNQYNGGRMPTTCFFSDVL